MAYRGRGSSDVELYARGTWDQQLFAYSYRGRGVSVEGSRGNVELFAYRGRGQGSTVGILGEARPEYYQISQNYDYYFKKSKETQDDDGDEHRSVILKT